MEPAGFPASTSILISRHHLRTKNPRLKKSVGQLYHRYTTVLHSFTARIIINTFGVCNFKVCFKSPLQKKNAKQKTIIFVISVCPHGRTRLLLDEFSQNLIFDDFFSKIWRENLTVALKKHNLTQHTYTT